MDYAFYNVDGLEEISIPDSVETIGRYAFYDCDKLKNVTISGGTETIGSNAFDSCDKLENIHLSEGLKEIGSGAFGSCKSLTEISIPDGTQKIGSSAFYECEYLADVTLPDSIVTLDSSAFGNCTRLTSINYPKEWTKGGQAFRGCTALKAITFPEGLTSIVDYAFYDVDGLEEISIPASVETIGYAAFQDCDKLKNVTISDGTESIGSYAFQSCDKLASVTLSRSTMSIGYGAFANCSSLKYLTGYYALKTISNNAFDGCQNVTVYAPIRSALAAYAVFHNFELIEISEERPADFVTALDMSTSGMTVNLNGITASGCIEVTVQYNFTESGTSSRELVISNTDNVSVMEETLYLDNVLLQNFRYDNNQLTIPLTSLNGTLKYFYRLDSRALLRVASEIHYNYLGENHTDIIGVLNENLEVLSLEPASEITSSSNVVISGIAPGGSSVQIYVDGTLAKTVTANRGGSYRTELVLPEATDGQVYSISASCNSSTGEVLSAVTKVSYQTALPEITDLVLYHGHAQKLDLIENDTIPAISLNPSEPMTFVVKVTNPEKIKHLYVTSTRSNIKRQIEAVWDEDAGCFVASGFFDSNDHRYIPGNISVEYVRNISVPQASPMETLPSQTNDRVTVSDVNETETSLQSVLTLYNENKDTVFDTLDYSFNIIKGASSTINGTELDLGKLTDVFDIISMTDTATDYLVPGKNGEKYILSLDWSDPKNVTMVAYDTLSTGSTAYSLVMKCDTVTSMQNGMFVDGAKAIAKAFDYGIDEYRLLNEIDKSSTIQDKAKAKREVALLSTGYNFMRAGFTASSILVAGAALTIGGPVAIGLGILFGVLASAGAGMVDKSWEITQSDILAGRYNTRWMLDPSGIIYEAVMGNPLPGATVMAYWVPYDEENPDFWTTVPEDDAGVLWDAQDWSQVNPLISDEIGWYAWDVPEGWWQIRATMDGYEEARSEWLSVAPPQTGINLGLVSRAEPVLIQETLTSRSLTLGFDRYLTMESLAGIELKNADGQTVAYELGTTGEYSPDGILLSRQAICTFTDTQLQDGDVLTVSWPADTLVSYSGTYVTAQSKTLTFTGEKRFTHPSGLTLYRGGSLEIEAALLNAEDGDTVQITAENPSFLTVTYDPKPDQDGKMHILLTPEIIGQTNLILTLEGTDITATVPVKIQSAVRAVSDKAEIRIHGKVEDAQSIKIYGSVKAAQEGNAYLIETVHEGNRMKHADWVRIQISQSETNWSINALDGASSVMLWADETYQPLLDDALPLP